MIVGLGNPGKEYEGTRHNVGFAVVEELARRHGVRIGRRTMKSVLGEGRIAGEQVILMRPMTFMNLSGDAVAAVCRYYRIAPEDVIVVTDDVALPPGRIRLRYKGSAGGHNGLDHILLRLGTPEVPRIRVGVGAAGSRELVSHVLSRASKEEQPLIEAAQLRAVEAVECAISLGFEMAMNRFNTPAQVPAGSAE